MECPSFSLWPLPLPSLCHTPFPRRSLWWWSWVVSPSSSLSLPGQEQSSTLPIIWSGKSMHLIYYEKLDHIPSSCIVLMVHVVKVVNTHIDAGPQSQRWSLRSTFNLEFRCFNQRRWTRQHSTVSELQIGRCMTRAINSARLALFIHRITSAKRTCEVRPALLIRESSTQLLMYSLDMFVS